jgi:putative PIN family toxin of toxin-antitoxin system
MNRIKIVLDTNIILSGLLSKKGSSYKILKLIPSGKFDIFISVPLILEYESVLLKQIKKLNLNKSDINDFLDYICSAAEHTKIFFLWRPILKDAYDDHILELAVASSADYIVTYNLKDFHESKKFGIESISPEDFLNKLRG